MCLQVVRTMNENRLYTIQTTVHQVEREKKNQLYCVAHATLKIEQHPLNLVRGAVFVIATPSAFLFRIAKVVQV